MEAAMAPALPSGTVTFLFTDIEGSTKLLQHLGDAYATVLGEHQALLRQAFTEHEGVEIDTAGDGFFVAFPTAPAAVAAAAAATRALARHGWPEGAPLRVRVGLHTGAPQLVGDHYVGLDVHRAARIAAAGHGGQILLSASTRVLAAQDLPEDTTLRDLGTYRLKDLQNPEPISQLVLAELPSAFPPLKTLDRRAHNLPIQPTELLGREASLTAVRALLERVGVRLVTVTGAGGIGKTRFALQVAAEVLEDFPDGIWFVRLSRLSDPELVLPTIAQTLGVKEVLGQPIAQTLSEHLQEKHLLLVLDNFEQVVAAAPEVGELLAESAQVKVLVTSRVPLHLRGEHNYALTPLPIPETGQQFPPEQLTQYAAVALFVERASAARTEFAVTAGNAAAIAEICARLDGLPLAIELAAARVQLLPPEALLSRLSSQLQLLTGGARDLEARQQTMRATIAWSVALLKPEDQVLFRRLAVFVGGATMDAIEAVCLAPEGIGPLAIDPLDGLGALVDQSLVQQREEEGIARFGMLHVIREYGLEQLKASAEEAAVSAAHEAYYLRQAEQVGSFLHGREHPRLLAQLEKEHDNLRAALIWLLEHGAGETTARFAAALTTLWETRGHWNEGRQWVARVLRAGDALPPHLHAKLLLWDGHVAHFQGDYATAVSEIEASLELFQGVDERVGTVGALTELAKSAVAQEQFARAQQLIDEALVFMQDSGDEEQLAEFHYVQVRLANSRGDYLGASRLLEQGLARWERLDDPHFTSQCKRDLGWCRLLLGDGPAAEALLQEALAVHQQMSDTNCSAIALGDLGMAALDRGAVDEAQPLLAQSLALFEEIARKPLISAAWIRLGMGRFAAGKLQEAEEAYIEGLRIERGLGNKQRTAAGLEALAAVALARGHPQRTARLLGAAAQALHAVGAAPPPLPPRLRAEQEQVAARAREALGEAAWRDAFAAGEVLSLEEALAEVLIPGP
jgi:predicted ATPase/class 3 adenylate cyclase